MALPHRVTQAFRRGERGGQAAGVLLIASDDFKVVNDTMGAQRRDELLFAVSLRLASMARASNRRPARRRRFPSCWRTPAARRTPRLRRARDPGLRRAVSGSAAAPADVSISLGVGHATEDSGARPSCSPRRPGSVRGQGAGKRQWRRFQPSYQEAMIERHELQESLHSAVADVLVQPALPPSWRSTPEPGGLRGPVRWPHAKRGQVPPEQFINLAEESGQIVPLGPGCSAGPPPRRPAGGWPGRWPGGPRCRSVRSVRQRPTSRPASFRDPASWTWSGETL
ncbi:hypothetical protein GCM10020229_60360 [Kitasatospora albolonga]